MRFELSDDQRAFAASARELFERECRPAQLRAAWTRDDGRVPGLWQKLGGLGMLGVVVPEALGGLGLGALEQCVVLEEAGRVAAPEPLIETSAVALPLLVQLGQCRSWVERAVRGDALIGVALGEPHVAFAAQADLLLAARDGALFALERADFGVVAQPSVDGSRRLARVEFEPRDETHVASGDGLATALADARGHGALAAAAQLVGLGARLLDLSRDHVTSRHQFGKPIGSFQAVKHQLATALLRLSFARPLVLRAAWSVSEQSADRAVHVSMAKAAASDAAWLCARTALQVHGAIGYSYEYDLHLYMKRVWALAAGFGDADWHRERVAARFLDGGASAPWDSPCSVP